jgi:release factor glutamine methyltransferase
MSETIAAALARATSRLASAGCDTSALDAEVLLAHVLGWSRARLIVERREPLDDASAGRFEALLECRVRREPIAYLVGEKEFWSLDLAVDRRVLVPRPETERIVEASLDLVRAWRSEGAVRIADVGTGSGAIAIALSASAPHGRHGVVLAVDRSVGALAVARRNVERHRLALRWSVRLVRGDLLSTFREASLDIVAANPPYLSPLDLAAAPPELAHEPRVALAGGDEDGLGVVRRLIVEARRVLRPGGFLVCEIGAQQGDAVQEAARSAGLFDDRILTDLAGRDRVLVAQRSGGTEGGCARTRA